MVGENNSALGFTIALPPEKMFLIGKEYMFVFSDSPDEIITSDDRFKHAANLKLTRILE